MSKPGSRALPWSRRLLFEFAGVLGGLVVVLVLAWSLSWLGLAARAAAEHQAMKLGESPIAFDFTEAGQLIGENAEGASSVRRVSEGLRLVFGAQGFNAGLNFRGRVLDAGLFPELRLVLDSSLPASLQLIRQAPDGRSWASVESIALVTGLNPLKLDLSQMSWQVLAGGQRIGDALPHTALPPQLAVLRFFVLAAEPAEVVLREARFYARAGASPVLQLAPLWARPELWLNQLDRQLRDSPGSLWLPPAYPASAVNPGWWRLAQASLAALVCGLALWAAWGRGPVVLRGLGFWALCAFPVLALWIGDNPAPALLGFLVGALVLGLRRLPPPPSPRNWLPVWAACAGVTAVVLGLLLLVPGSSLQFDPGSRIWTYTAWALLQQWALQRIVYCRLRRAMPQPVAAWLAALAFALWHAPNLGLMVLTLVGGRVWCELYERGGRLLPVALSHAALGLAALQWLPHSLLRSAEVSSRFLGLVF